LREVLLAGLKIAEPPGQSFNYGDDKTPLLVLILEQTQCTRTKYPEEKIWQPLGIEYQATWSIDSLDDDFELMDLALNAP
jgi:hypothetical protein